VKTLLFMCAEFFIAIVIYRLFHSTVLMVLAVVLSGIIRDELKERAAPRLIGGKDSATRA
jgi:hypothetical protein